MNGVASIVGYSKFDAQRTTAFQLLIAYRHIYFIGKERNKKPGDEVMNFFEKKTYKLPKANPLAHSLDV